MSRINELKEDFKNILGKWKQALDQPKSELSRDAAILRFVRRPADEVGWKLIQVLAREEGHEVKSPRQAFQQAFSLGWVSDEIIWFDILKARNTATHVYRETYANALYQELDTYYKAFKEFEEAVTN